MKLSLCAITSELDISLIEGQLTCDPLPKLEYPMLLDRSDDRRYGNILYVGTAAEVDASLDDLNRHLKSNPHLTLSILSVGRPSCAQHAPKNLELAWTGNGVTLLHAFNATQRAFQRLTAWKEQLDSLVQAGASLEDLVRASTRIFKNDLCVSDHLGRVVAYHAYRPARLSPELTDHLQTGTPLPDELSFEGMPHDAGAWARLMQTPSLHPLNASPRHQVACIPIHPAQEGPFIVTLYPNHRPVGEKDFATLTVFADAVMRHYEAQGSTRSGKLKLFTQATLRQLIGGTRPSDPELARCCAVLGWDQTAHTYLHLAASPLAAKEGGCLTLETAPSSLCAALQEVLPCCAFDVEGHLAVIVNLDQSHLTVDALLELMTHSAERLNLIMGMSDPHRGLDDAAGYHAQAALALRLPHANGQPRVLRFGDHRLEAGLTCIAEQLPPHAFCPPSLLALVQEEPLLYETLQAFLFFNCNSSAAARQLGLQRNSFAYRLDKARKLLDADLDDPQERMTLQLAIALLKAPLPSRKDS